MLAMTRLDLRLRSVALALLLLPWAPTASHGEWIPNGVRVCDSERSDEQPRVCSDGAGGAIVGWNSLAAGGYYDLYAQRVRADGTLAWPGEGVPICTVPAAKFLYQMVEDGAGGAYFVWHDRRHGIPGVIVDQIYLQRVQADGSIAPGWPVDGLRVCPALGGQWQPSLAPDGSGGVYVTWDDFRNGIAYEYTTDGGVYAQRIQANGERAPGWPEEGLLVCTAALGQGFSKVVADGVGGAFVVWDDGRNPESWDVYASRLDPGGTLAAGWPADGLALCTAPRHQGATATVADGQGGLIVAWQDARTAPPDMPDFRYVDVYAQRVTSEGAIAPGWPVDGAPVCTAPADQQALVMVADGAGGAIVAWSDYRNYSESAADLYAQRIGPDGQPAVGWPVDGVALSRRWDFQTNLKGIATDGRGGALVVFHNSPGDDIYAQHVTASGPIGSGWNPDGEGVCVGPGGQDFPVAASDGASGLIAAWSDSRNAGFGSDIYAQHVTVDYPTATLATAQAEVAPGRVALAWWFAQGAPTEATVERRAEAAEWRNLGAAVSAGGDRWTFTDATAPAGRHAYRLRYAGERGLAYTPETWVTVPAAHGLALAGFSPNPSTARPVIAFTLANGAPATLAVYDAAGRAVFRREVGTLGPGSHTVDLGGAATAPGLYWIRLTQADRTFTAQGLVLR
jgi:hypothetical protein